MADTKSWNVNFDEISFFARETDPLVATLKYQGNPGRFPEVRVHHGDVKQVLHTASVLLALGKRLNASVTVNDEGVAWNAILEVYKE